MASGVKSNGVDLDDLFDPDVKGDGPTAPGIQSRGVPLRYAALKYGSKRANVGVANAGSDVSNLWAAKGTASYGLSINGKSYTATATSAGSVSSATLQFSTNNGTFAVTDPNRSPTTVASGAIPAGATQCRVTTTLTSGTAATVLNPLSSFVALSATNRTVEVGNFQDESGQPAILSTYTLKIEYRNSSGVVISTTSIGFTVNTRPT